MTNLQHLKYAVEIAEEGSINKAGDKLFVGQPSLSRAIKSLETSLGVEIFHRSPQGMELTPDGELFIRYAKSILQQVDDMENLFQNNNQQKTHFSIAVPRGSYISEAFARFSHRISQQDTAEVFYRETDAMRVIEMVQRQEYRLGIIRYAEIYQRFYQTMLEEKAFHSHEVASFHYVLLMNRNSPLMQRDSIHFSDLQSLSEIAHADPNAPALPFAAIRKEEQPNNIPRRILVYERASQFDLLSQNPDTFMWVSPVSQTLLDRYGLVQRVCSENRRMYRDVLIHRNDYHLSELDEAFLQELEHARDDSFFAIADALQ